MRVYCNFRLANEHIFKEGLSYSAHLRGGCVEKNCWVCEGEIGQKLSKNAHIFVNVAFKSKFHVCINGPHVNAVREVEIRGQDIGRDDHIIKDLEAWEHNILEALAEAYVVRNIRIW